MTNAELIKALREVANWIVAVSYNSEYAHDGLKMLHYEDSIRAAADALEAADKKIAELMPKEGVWQGIIIDGQYWAITCSNCHQVGFNAKTPYCPNCGAKMKGANDGES